MQETTNHATVERKMNAHIVYKCIVSTSMNAEKTNLRMAKGDFKKRYNITQIHLGTNGTQRKYHYLSIFMPTLNWSIVKSVLTHSNISKEFLLRLHEKLEIVNFEDQDHLLNKRSELVYICRHASKYLLHNYKAND